MCGIAAIIPPAESQLGLNIAAMADCLTHRGPDASATIDAGGAWFGHRRLSIIDLSGGAQPMSDPTERLWIVFNGEIFNFRELRASLESRGRRFRTRSDTEVLLEGYLEFGEKITEHLNGQFAFAIWDRIERKLFAARDRMGEKPLYWAQTPDGSLVVASEIKSILASGLITPQLDPISIELFLTLLYVPPDRTIYQNISVVPPAHALEWRDGRIRQWRYWEPKYSQLKFSDPREAVEEVRRLIDQAVHRQMVADVPVGAFLSGGLDSSTIVACMTRHTSAPVKTFAVGFEDLINELPYARAVADLYKTEHNELQMSMPLGELLDKMTDVYDEPFADSSNIPTFMVAQYASRSVKVVLSGDGGDELFGGYWWNAPRLQDLRMMKNPPSLLTLGTKAFAWRALARLNHGLRSRRHRAVTLYTAARDVAKNPDIWDRHFNGQCFFKIEELDQLSGNAGRPSVRNEIANSYLPGPQVQGMDRVADFDIRSYLPGDILVKVDRAAMANSLETRAPFLDVDLAEFVLGLPTDMRFSESQSKPLLHQACEDLWPDTVRNRPKQGFGGPVKQWLTRPDVRSRFEHATRSDGRLSELLPGLEKTLPNARPYQKWILMCLGLWLENHSANNFRPATQSVATAIERKLQTRVNDSVGAVTNAAAI